MPTFKEEFGIDRMKTRWERNKNKERKSNKSEFFLCYLKQVISLLPKTVVDGKQGKVLQIVTKVAEYKEVERGLQFRIQKTKIRGEK